MPKHVFTKISIWFTATFMRFHSMWRCIIEGLHFCICLVAQHSIVKVLTVQAAAGTYIFCNTCTLYRKIVQQSGWHVERCSTKVYEADGRASGTCTLQIFGQPKLWEEYAEISIMLHKGRRYLGKKFTLKLKKSHMLVWNTCTNRPGVALASLWYKLEAESPLGGHYHS